MKKGILVLFIISICGTISTGNIFAQTATPTPAPTGVSLAQITSPTPTPDTNPKASNTTPTPTPKPSSQSTPAPTSASVNPTAAPQSAQQSQKPTPTPTHIPPTPTPKQKPLLLLTDKKPPVKPPVAPLNTIITAPFDLVMNSLPGNYYNDEGLSQATTKTLLALGSLSLLSGTILLAWPTLVRAKKRLLLPVPKERKSLPYLAGRA